MNLRILLGRLLVRLGRFVESLSVTVMRPDDLMELTKQSYGGPAGVEGWSRDKVVDSGLEETEKRMLAHLPLRSGRLLLLGLGGGRDAIALAKVGFEVTGVDFVPEMIERAKANALKRGVRIEGIIQDFSRLDVPAASYDVVWLSAFMYSCIPTRKRRVEMLKRIAKALKPSGYFVCEFSWDRSPRRSRLAVRLRKAFAFVTLGNFWYEPGDVLWGGVEFVHQFASPAEIKSEFEEGGFEVLYAEIPESSVRGGAVLRKRTELVNKPGVHSVR